jgi:AraC-like DNA-binding protein
VVEYILTRRHKELSTLDEMTLTRIFGVQRSYLTRRFKKEIHMALDRFIMQQRIMQAFFMIEECCDLSIRELAQRLGFHDPQNFSRQFHHLFLIDPDRYIQLRKEQV